MKNVRLFLALLATFVVATLPTVSSAQIDPLRLIFALAGDKLEKKEVVSAGVCSMNVFVRHEGRERYFSSINGGLSYVVSLDRNGSVGLQPVPMINTSHMPRNVDISIFSAYGPSKKLRLRVRGGKVHSDGTVSNNAGFIDKNGNPTESPILWLDEMPLGAIGIGVSWGDGQSALFQFHNVPMDQFFSMYNSEKVRAAVHGAGQVMNPQAPSVWGMTSDGRVRNFATEAELQAVMGSSNQVTVEHPEVSQTVESAPTPGIATRRESSEVVWKYGYVPSTTNWSDERIAKDIDSSDKPKSFEARSSYIVAGHRLYLLLRSDGGFDVEVVRDGNIIFRTKGKKSNGRYAAFFKMTPKLGDEIVVSDGQGRRSALIVVSKEEIR